MAQHNRPDAIRKAADHLQNIHRLLEKLRGEAERLAGDASWPAVGSLGHIHETLAELAGERG